jgi:hypothetical protein
MISKKNWLRKEKDYNYTFYKVKNYSSIDNYDKYININSWENLYNSTINNHASIIG